MNRISEGEIAELLTGVLFSDFICRVTREREREREKEEEKTTNYKTFLLDVRTNTSLYAISILLTRRTSSV